MRHVVLFLSVGSVACGQGDTVIDRRFDACDPIVLDAHDATSDQQAGVLDAIALWRDHGVTSLGVDPIPGAPAIPIVFEEANPASYGYYDDEAAIIYVNVALDADPEARAIAIAHEVGHAFGLYHVGSDDRPSLMNPHNLTVPPTDEDVLELEGLWGTCTSSSNVNGGYSSTTAAW